MNEHPSVSRKTGGVYCNAEHTPLCVLPGTLVLPFLGDGFVEGYIFFTLFSGLPRLNNAAFNIGIKTTCPVFVPVDFLKMPASCLLAGI